MLRLSLFDQVRNQFPGDGGQGNAVPLVAGGEDQARQCFGGADNRGAVLTEGPQAGKCADDVGFERVSKVFGLAALSRAVVCEKDFDTICQTAEDYLGSAL